MDAAYELCSIASSNETMDNLPGPGRVLGNFYTSAGRRLENEIGRVAVRLGCGPHIAARKIQEILNDKSLRSTQRLKKLRNSCKSLTRYIK